MYEKIEINICLSNKRVVIPVNDEQPATPNRVHGVLLPPHPKIRLGQNAQHSQQKMGVVGNPVTVT